MCIPLELKTNVPTKLDTEPCEPMEGEVVVRFLCKVEFDLHFSFFILKRFWRIISRPPWSFDRLSIPNLRDWFGFFHR